MVNAKDVTDFSVDLGTIDIDDMTDMDTITAYTSSFSVNNIFSLNVDLDYNGLTSKVLSNNFRGTFQGNGNRLMNFTTRAFGNLTLGCSIENVVFYNFIGSSVIYSMTSTASVTDCICCGTFSSTHGAFCYTMSGTTLTFENNAVLLSGASRLIGGNMGCISSISSYNVTSCFVACTSDVYIYGSSKVGLISASGTWSGQNGVNFNGYLNSKNVVGYSVCSVCIWNHWFFLFGFCV